MLDELIEHRVDVIVGTRKIGAKEQLAKQSLIMRRKDAFDGHHAVVAGNLSQHLDRQPRLPPQKFRRAADPVSDPGMFRSRADNK